MKFRRLSVVFDYLLAPKSRRMRNVAETSGGSWDFLMIGLYD